MLGLRGSVATRVTAVATAAASAALCLLLAGLYLAVTRQLDAAVDNGLTTRITELARGVASDGPQVLQLDPLAELYGGSPATASVRVAGRGPLLADPASVPASGVQLSTRGLRLQRVRVAVRVAAVRLPGGRVLAVGVSRAPQDEAGERLLVGLSVAGPLLLLLVGVAVHRSVRSALHPVDLLAREAAQISAGRDTGRRLPRVPGHDEVARLAATLDDMLGRLSHAFDRERAFVDDASHELRTPVAVLRGELELALSDLADTSGVETSLRAALAEAERLTRLTEDLLVLARDDAGSLVLRQERVDVDELLRDTCARLARAYGLQLTAQPSALWWSGDRDRLEQALSNLGVNARQAGATRVLLTARADGDDLLLAVEDDGPGFPPGFVDRAFERFSRADGARTRTSGAGLGLSLVAAVAAACGGSVSTDDASALGGATVRLRLPGLVRAQVP